MKFESDLKSINSIKINSYHSIEMKVHSDKLKLIRLLTSSKIIISVDISNVTNVLIGFSRRCYLPYISFENKIIFIEQSIIVFGNFQNPIK